ncbi:lipocalin-15 isoform X2 [Manis javanica]|uniref:lipocalin-15 isoform X2 n=1 Tax=Manis javanica TaxID=9974 RepID=UPI003C6D7CC7
MGMKSVLLGWVLALPWVSGAQVEVLVQPGFDAKKFSGLWHVVSMVSDCKVFLGKKDHLLMSTRAVQATAEGGLSVHMEFPWADGCNQVDAQFLKVGSEGHFRVPGRTQDASPQAEKAFQDFYPTVGLPDDMMVKLPKSDACSSAGKEAP